MLHASSVGNYVPSTPDSSTFSLDERFVDLREYRATKQGKGLFEFGAPHIYNVAYTLCTIVCQPLYNLTTNTYPSRT